MKTKLSNHGESTKKPISSKERTENVVLTPISIKTTPLNSWLPTNQTAESKSDLSTLLELPCNSKLPKKNSSKMEWITLSSKLWLPS